MASRVAAVFVLRSSFLSDSRRSDEGLDLCRACEALTGVGSIDGTQIISGLWRIYSLSVAARRQLIIEGISFRGQAVTVLDANPFLTHSDGPTTKLIIGNVPISVANSEIEKGLKELDVCLRSHFKEETYRDSGGRTTHFKAGRRFGYIDMPKIPLPKKMKIGPNFLGFLYYRELEAGKGEGDGGKTTATQPGSGQAHDQCPSSGDLVAQAHSDPDADSYTIFDTSESTEVNNVASRKAQSTINNKSATERAKATLRNRQTTLDWFKAGSQRPTRRRSEPRNKRQLCEHSSTSPSNVEKKGCVDDREETDSVSAATGEGETAKSRSNTIDWFRYRETPQ